MTDADKTSVFGYLKNPSMVDFPGQMAAVFFTSGCNFGCGFCHNANLMGATKPGLSRERLDEACKAFKADWVHACVISGGEPTLAPDLNDLVKLFKGHGFAVKLDTNGSQPDQLEAILPLVDYVAMDVKCALESYPDLTGHRDVDAIARSIDLIKRNAKDYEFRTTVIQGFHDESQVRSIGDAVAGAKRTVVQPFLPREDLPCSRFSDTPRTTPEVLRNAGAILETVVDEVIVRGAGKETSSPNS